MNTESKPDDNKNEINVFPLAAWFLGPRAENSDVWEELLTHIFQDYMHWRRNYFPSDPVVVGRAKRRSDSHEAWIDRLTAELDETLNELKHHFPFHSPRYVAHMLSEQTLPSVLGYFAGMLYNPNNVTPEAAPITVELELQVGQMVAEMLGYKPATSWAHICSGGTIANLEALWVARSAQFIPFIVREFCKDKNIPLIVKTANLVEQSITELNDDLLIRMRPNESLFMLQRLAEFLHQKSKRSLDSILHEINSQVEASSFNVARRGLHQVLRKINLTPVILVSAAAHYSVVKAANILGYGEDAVRSVPVNDRFQIDISQLKKTIDRMRPDEYIAAVVGIVGTTEEGAVDPIHEIHFMRQDMQQSQNRSFWMHVDAAWGGYFRSLFCGTNVRLIPRSEDVKTKSRLDAIVDEYVRELKIEEKLTIEFDPPRGMDAIEIRWASKDIYAAFLAMSDADSITIDPHKMGYVPYPAGIVAFKNSLVTQLIQQRAQYISDERGGVTTTQQIDRVGPYILEGSKPGAAALGCWLAHKTIPLTVKGHGKIARTSLLNAQKLFRYLVNHRYMFRRIQKELTGSADCAHPFTFIPFFEPDTNIVCFMVRPMAFTAKGKLIEREFELKWLNVLNEEIYKSASISDVKGEQNSAATQAFFVSRTRFEVQQYAYSSMSRVLKRMGVNFSRKEYESEGIFVLRSAVMNPWYFHAQSAGMDYLFGFVKFLHRVAEKRLREVNQKREEEIHKQRVIATRNK